VNKLAKIPRLVNAVLNKSNSHSLSALHSRSGTPDKNSFHRLHQIKNIRLIRTIIDKLIRYGKSI
jgi:hypothetical protein